MKELSLEVLGWLGYLERPAVMLQLALIVAAVVLTRQMRRRRWLGRWPLLGYTPLGLGLLAALALLLQKLHQPHGLCALWTWLWLGWYSLQLLSQQLLRWLPQERVHQIETRLLRPGYLVMSALVMINELDNVQDVALAWLIQRAVGMSSSRRKALELMLRYAVVTLGLIAVAIHLGLNTTALIAVAGGLSVGLGFGIKEVFSNFVSGLWLLFEGSVRPGEVLMLDGDPCEVRKLGLRATLLWRDRDNAELLIPNQTFFTEMATTYTASDRMRRSQVSVGAAYHHDPESVIALLEATARQVNRVLPNPAPKALLLSYGDSAINYALRFWIANPMDNVTICSEVNQAIWHAFKREGIEIPFPQQVEYSMVWPPEQHLPNTGNH
ncbi:MAG: mechanosensitive ion channel [Cyanobacteria bacterium K_DeepCast_35m_m2_155]|nr:mechanosensitive ion channel [Cyanobacteria bacterium K_DeepCast_35m_m2_155]